MANQPVAVDLPLVAHDRERAGTSRMSVVLTLTLIVALSAALRMVLGSLVDVPTIFPDELGFWELGRGIGEAGRWEIGGQAVRGFTYAPLYPLLIAPTHLVTHSLVDAYTLVKVVNSVVMSLAAVPTYFLARRARVSVRGSLASAALAVLVPSFVYTSHVMSESLSYPLFLCAVLSMTAALERPSAGRQLTALIAIGATVLTRAEMVVLFPAFACAILLLGWTETRTGTSPSFWRRIWRFKWTWLVGAAGGLAALVFVGGDIVGSSVPDRLLRSAGRGGGVPTGLPNGSQVRLFVEPIRLEAVPANLVRHLAELDVYSGVVPFAAFALVALATLGLRTATGSTTRFVVVGVSTGLWLVALAAVYETTFELHGFSSAHVFDRYTFYLVPLFVVALVLWVEEGLPRPRRLTTGIALAVALLPLALPLDRLLESGSWGTNTGTVGLVPLVWAKDVVGDGWLLTALLLCATCALALVFARLPASRGAMLVPVCAVVFVASGVLATASNVKLSVGVSQSVGQSDPAWIDRAVGSAGRVAIVWRGTSAQPPPERSALRDAVFFNRSVVRVYDLEDPLSTGYPSTGVTVRRGGEIRTEAGSRVNARYVLARRSLRVVGRPIARDEGSGLVLYRVVGPLRVAGARD